MYCISGSTMSKVVSIPIDFTLNPMTVVCLERLLFYFSFYLLISLILSNIILLNISFYSIFSFEVTSSTDQLHSIKIDLNAALHGIITFHFDIYYYYNYFLFTFN